MAISLENKIISLSSNSGPGSYIHFSTKAFENGINPFLLFSTVGKKSKALVGEPV